MGSLIAVIILLGLAYFFWFELPKEAEKESSRGFVKIFKGIFGVKGYILMAKFLAIFMVLSAGTELYKFITSIIS